MNSGMGSRIPDAARSASEFGIPFLLVVYLAFASGGYDLVVRSQIGIIVWWAVLLGILAGILPVARITRAGFTMFVIVAMLFLWTAISTLFWTESAERSVIEVTRVATLLGTFVLLVLVQGKSGIRHGVTAIAAAVALISVVSLGDRLLPNLVPFGADYVLPADYPRAQAQHDTQVPKSGDVAEVEAVEAGIAVGAQEEDLETPDAPKKLSSKEEKRQARQEEKRKKAEQKKQEEQQLAKRQKQAQTDRKRGGVIGFLASCIAELKRVQWPDRDTLIQATAVTVVFVIVAAVYLGLADLAFNWLVQRVI